MHAIAPRSGVALTLDAGQRLTVIDPRGEQVADLNRSRVMLKIVADTVGRHDFLLTPCSVDTFRITYGDIDPHRGCFGNLAAPLAPFGIGPDAIPSTVLPAP